MAELKEGGAGDRFTVEGSSLGPESDLFVPEIVGSPLELQQSLVFKGGTALKKLFFGDYRFSEDLDYSVIKAPKGQRLMTAMESAVPAVPLA